MSEPQIPTAAPAYYVDRPEVLHPHITGGYVRHRDRMVQESVYDDLRDTLIACRWLAGTTVRPVWNPYGAKTWGIVTTAPTETLPLLENSPVVLIDYFPEAEGGGTTGEPETSKTAINTLALDSGTRLDSVLREMGSSTAEDVLYRFSMAFYAASDGVAQALLGDLADRYRGRQVRDDDIELWNYNEPSELPVVRMSVESFEFTAAADQEIAPYEVNLYFAELIIEDYAD